MRRRGRSRPAGGCIRRGLVSWFTLVLASALWAAPAWAQDDGATLGAAFAWSHESNLMRLGRDQPAPEGTSRADSTLTTTLDATYRRERGRQRLLATALLQDLRHVHNDAFDHQGHRFELDGATHLVGPFGGALHASRQRRLARFSSDEIGVLAKKNIEDTTQADATLRLGDAGPLRLQASLGWLGVDYSAAEYDSRNFRQTDASLGAHFVPGPQATLGVAWRSTRGHYPRFQALPEGGHRADHFERDELELTALWSASGASRLSARLAYGRTDYMLNTARNHHGLGGMLAWDWQPGARLHLRAQLRREPTQDSYFLRSDGADASVEYGRVADFLRLRARHALSAKVELNAGVDLVRRSLVRTLSPAERPATSADARDSTTRLMLGVRWEPTRSLQVGADWQADERARGSTLSTAFRASSISVFVRARIG